MNVSVCVCVTVNDSVCNCFESENNLSFFQTVNSCFPFRDSNSKFGMNEILELEC